MQFTSLVSYLLPSCPPAPPLTFPSPLPSPVPYPTHSVCNAAIEYPATRCVCNRFPSPKLGMRMQGLSVRHSLLCLYSVCCVSSRHPRRGACAIHPQVLHSNKLPRPKVQLLSRDVYVYICMCVHVCMCVCLCVCVYLSLCACVCVCMCVCVCVCMCMCMYMCMCACVHVYVCVHAYVYVYMCVCVCVCFVIKTH